MPTFIGVLPRVNQSHCWCIWWLFQTFEKTKAEHKPLIKIAMVETHAVNRLRFPGIETLIIKASRSSNTAASVKYVRTVLIGSENSFNLMFLSLQLDTCY